MGQRTLAEAFLPAVYEGSQRKDNLVGLELDELVLVLMCPGLHKRPAENHREGRDHSQFWLAEKRATPLPNTHPGFELGFLLLVSSDAADRHSCVSIACKTEINQNTNFDWAWKLP